MPFFDIFASSRWSPLRMRTKVVSFFIFFQELSNKKNLRLYDQRWLKSPQGGPALTVVIFLLPSFFQMSFQMSPNATNKVAQSPKCDCPIELKGLFNFSTLGTNFFQTSIATSGKTKWHSRQMRLPWPKCFSQNLSNANGTVTKMFPNTLPSNQTFGEVNLFDEFGVFTVILD